MLVRQALPQMCPQLAKNTRCKSQLPFCYVQCFKKVCGSFNTYHADKKSEKEKGIDLNTQISLLEIIKKCTKGRESPFVIVIH